MGHVLNPMRKLICCTLLHTHKLVLIMPDRVHQELAKRSQYESLAGAAGPSLSPVIGKDMHKLLEPLAKITTLASGESHMILSSTFLAYSS